MKICITLAAVCALAVAAFAAPGAKVAATPNHYGHNPVPEPMSMIVLAIGAGVVALRKKK